MKQYGTDIWCFELYQIFPWIWILRVKWNVPHIQPFWTLYLVQTVLCLVDQKGSRCKQNIHQWQVRAMCSAERDIMWAVALGHNNSALWVLICRKGKSRVLHFLPKKLYGIFVVHFCHSTLSINFNLIFLFLIAHFEKETHSAYSVTVSLCQHVSSR